MSRSSARGLSAGAKAALAGGLVLILGLLAVLFNAFGSNPREVPFMLRGQSAPAFELSVLDGSGEAVSLASLRGKPVVLNFWASWCGPCKYEHPVMDQASEIFADQAHFYGIVFEDTEDNARKFLREHGNRMKQLVDSRSSVSVDYGVAGVPETYFIDSKGVILDKHIGPMNPKMITQRMEQLAAHEAQLTAQGAQP